MALTRAKLEALLASGDIDINVDMSMYLPLTGGTLTGDLKMEAGTHHRGQARRMVHYHPLASLTNFNDVVEEWALAPTGITNAPPIAGGYVYVQTVFYSTLDYSLQIAYGYTTNAVYCRRNNKGTWSAWYKVSP